MFLGLELTLNITFKIQKMTQGDWKAWVKKNPKLHAYSSISELDAMRNLFDLLSMVDKDELARHKC